MAIGHTQRVPAGPRGCPGIWRTALPSRRNSGLACPGIAILAAKNSGKRLVVAGVLAALPILGLRLYDVIPFRPAVTVYAALVGLSFALGRWLLAAGHLVLPGPSGACTECWR